MNSRVVISVAVLALLFLLGPVRGSETLSHKKKEVKTVLSDLEKTVKNYKKYVAEKEKALRKRENDMLTVNNRKASTNLIDMCQDRMNNYKAEARDDLRFLNVHWEELSQAQKESAQEAEESMKDATGMDKIEY